MPILRAGPWGNISDAYQTVPSNTGVALTRYPVNCAKADWPNQPWTAWYEEASCSPPGSVTVDEHTFGGIITLDLISSSETSADYYWSDPSGPYYGEADLRFNGVWTYTESFSYGAYYEATGGTDICEPEGVYDDGVETRTITS